MSDFNSVRDPNNVLLSLIAHALFEAGNGQYWMTIFSASEDWEGELVQLCRKGCYVAYALSDRSIQLNAVLKTQWEFMTHIYPSEAEKAVEAESRSRAQKRWSSFKKRSFNQQVEYFRVLKSPPPANQTAAAIKEAASGLRLLLMRLGANDWVNRLDEVEKELISLSR